MKQSLSLRVSQHLALTPQLQQSIRLLQLSTLELNQELEQILAENPLLERDDDPLDAAWRMASDGALAAPPSAPDESGSSAPDLGADSGPRELDGMRLDAGRPAGDDDDETPTQLATATITLRDHLMLQVSEIRLSQRDRGLLTVLIEALDEDGYLEQSLAEIVAMLPDELGIDEDELHCALTLLQTFEPAGVGARDPGECLRLQLDHGDPGRWPEAAQPPTVALARRIVCECPELLAARDYPRLRRLLGCGDEDLRAAQALIKRLDPHPGAAFGRREADLVIPDVIVRRVKNAWQAFLNPDVMPKLRVNQMYAQILRSQRASANPGLSARLQEARWLIKNVQQRFDTILRVAQAIVDRQRNFFTHGEVAMRPLVLREIADTLGLHESTVSRVTSQKYLLTPLGTFEMKYFFGSHVATDTGGAASSTAIRALIKQLIGAEDQKRPLSDSQIADTLGEQGIMVARRTIAKYRESLKIPPVAMRRSI